jgi:hypothetical protein
MNFDVQGVLEGVLAGSVWLIIGLLVASGYHLYWPGRKTRAVWRLGNFMESSQIVVASLDPQSPGEHARPSTGMAELRAVSFVRQSLIHAYPQAKEPTVTFSSRFQPAQARHTLISVGGGKHNRVTRIIAGHYEFPFEVLSSPTRIRERGTGHIFTPKREAGAVHRDYGLITRIPNPLRKEATVFLLRGTHAYGVSAAGMMFTLDWVGELANAVQKLGPYWQVLIEVEGANEEGLPRVISAHPVDIPTETNASMGIASAGG